MTDTSAARRSSELPYFLDLGVHGSYRETVGERALTFRLDLGNLLNRRANFQRARLAIDDTRNDAGAGSRAGLCLQAPLLNAAVAVLAER